MPGTLRTTSGPSPDVDRQLFLDPLGFLRTEIYRQRVACNTLEALASSGSNGDFRADAERLLHYVTAELPLHLADLEESLLPLLAQRVLPSDNFETVLARHRSQRACNDEVMDRLVTSLRRVAAVGAGPVDLQPDAGTLIEGRRRDLTWESDVILPLAEMRFVDADLVALGTAMADRRGIPHPK